MKLHGIALEKFLSDFSDMITSNVPPNMNPSIVQGFRSLAIEIARHHLAGFSREHIVQEFSTLAGSRDKCDQIFPGIIAQLENIVLMDPKTGEEVTPKVGDIYNIFDFSPDHSIEMARYASAAKPLDAFTKGDYETCALLGDEGSDAFGRHIFYQLSVIAYLRLGEKEQAKNCAIKAKLGLSSEPWFLRLVALSAGFAKPSDLEPLATSTERLFQLGCFMGLRAFSAGDKTLARELLNKCKGATSDLLAESILVAADLRRC